jgi:predicted GNAT family N-acyltransferase
MSESQKLIIKKCNINDLIALEVFRLRYDIFANELSCSDESLDHSKETCTDSLDDIADIYLIQENDEVISSIRTVFAFNGSEKELKRYECELTDVRKVVIKQCALTGLLFGFTWFIIYCSDSLGCW